MGEKKTSEVGLVHPSIHPLSINPSIHHPSIHPSIFKASLYVQRDERTGVLKLSNLSANMSGKYVCTASNSAGAESCDISLDISTCRVGMIVGATVGSVLGFIFLLFVCLAFLVFFRRRRYGEDDMANEIKGVTVSSPQFQGRVGFLSKMPSTDVSLYVNNTRESDSGRYVCQVIYADKPGVTAELTLDVKACDCSLEGSLTRLCDGSTGQCQCRPGAFGQRCDGCQRGHWGFPSCRPCRCNGHADLCQQRTGACIGCRDNTGGDSCERCANGYYGNPVLGLASGGQCRPCPCPDGPDSGRHFAASCYQDNRNRQIICNCNQGYTGARCEECAPGYYGNPSQPGGRCQPCQCNNNIDMSDMEACDRQTGECRKCLYNTEGPNCGICRSGYFGDASLRNCRKCTCNFLGTERSQCMEREDCVCQRATGQCQCLPSVVGLTCDHCAPDHWNLAGGRGCEACGCHPNNSVTSSCNEVQNTSCVESTGPVAMAATNAKCHCRGGPNQDGGRLSRRLCIGVAVD
ncbi:unnamed protein product [Menidia menidia]|uniref:(Atlantic silverside) hypothetical protein n=1 Tax=Menidia menidia TaxID=238744 RepID=A0A8S4AQR3_9TELE|nr:unnamed protein product [Menidia menidia]